MKNRIRKSIAALLTAIVFISLCVPAVSADYIEGDYKFEAYELGIVIKSYIGDATDIVVPSAITNPSGGSDKVIRIGNEAFSAIKRIKTVSIPDTVKIIGNEAFHGCTGLTSVTFGSGLNSIGESAFESCTSLQSAVLPGKLASIGNCAFQFCTKLTSMPIPDSVQSIGNEAFSNCVELTSVTFGNGLTSIGTSAFDSCVSLRSVVLPNRLNSLGAGAFQGCTKLTSVILGESLETVSGSAFLGCEKLETVGLGSSVKTFESMAFNGCPDISTLYLGANVEAINFTTFDSDFSGTVFCYPDSFAKEYAISKNYRYSLILVQDIELTVPDKLTYFIGEEPEFSGLVVLASYGSGAPKRNVTKLCNLQYDSFTSAGTYIVTVSYSIDDSDFSKTFSITVVEPSVTEIVIETEPTVKTYRYKTNSGIDLSGLVLTAKYNDGKEETVSDLSEVSASGFNERQTGVQTITVSYEGQTATYQVNVELLWWQWIIKIVLFGWIWY